MRNQRPCLEIHAKLALERTLSVFVFVTPNVFAENDGVPAVVEAKRNNYFFGATGLDGANSPSFGFMRVVVLGPVPIS